LIHVSRYARWDETKGRRETWEETVGRLVEYYKDHICQKYIGYEGFSIDEYTELRDAIYNLEVMPSMRALMTAGAALDRCNVAAYNCAYLPVDSPRAFDETMYILMCGTGVGFSVERKYVDKLPVVAEEFHSSGVTVVVADSKEGWARAFRQFVSLLYNGDIPRWDVSRLRPAGARLKTFGGRASGPEPLAELFRFTIDLFTQSAGRKLSTLECHDLMCKIADIVVVGGVRRSAMISLSDVTDDRLRSAKVGEWYKHNGQRRLANNSAVYERRRPDVDFFMKEWIALYESKSGERGIFNREACKRIVERNGRRDPNHDFGTNPCSEIILRPYQFCNLTEVVVRFGDTIDDLKRKVRLAAILGTIQSTFTDFRYLRNIWKQNCEEERLLGVSLTGFCDRIISNEELEELKQIVNETNVEWAERLGVAPSTATTCNKPSGTVSQLVNSSSGLHTRFAPYYLRAIRADNKDPLTQFLIDVGVPNEPDVMKPEHTTVFYFPIKSPKGALTRNDLTAVEALEMWKDLQEHWCEHKPSVTINIKDEEWLRVASWVFDNFDLMSGVSFLPHDGGTYRQAPYQELTKEEYEDWTKKMPSHIDWTELQKYEKEDNTTGSQEFACSGNVCEVVEVGMPDE
jgi:ribonucleoside-diphosphate reductase alpha chain